MATDESIIMEIANEVRHQRDELGFTPEHDDAHTRGELTWAAAAYLTMTPVNWPFERDMWKPQSRRADLIRSAALIVAEILRIDRAHAKRSLG